MEVLRENRLAGAHPETDTQTNRCTNRSALKAANGHTTTAAKRTGDSHLCFGFELQL